MVRTLGAGAARAAWLLAVATAAPACRERASTSPAEGVAEGEPPPPVPTEGFVVLPWGTRVYVEPRFGGASSRLGWPGAAPPPWPTTGYVARVVGQRDGFVEIAPILPPITSEQHCGPLLDDGAFDVRLYVSPWALAPVLTRELEVSLDDGSTLSLRPGALAQPIPDDPRGRWAISAGGIRVRAVVPDDAIALAYAPQPMPMPAQRNWQLPEGRPFSFDGWPLELELGFGQDVAIASVTPQGEGHVVELTTPCARVLAHADTPPVSWSSHSFEPFPEFGLGAPERVPAGVLETVGLAAPAEPEPEAPDEAASEAASEDGGVVEILSSDVEPSAGIVVDMQALSAIEFGPSIHGEVVGSIPGGLPVRPEHAFEQGAPLYLSPAGPAAGTLAELRVFSEDAWLAGDRMCFHTSFGSRFDPMLPVCLPANEARLRNPAVDVHDFAAWVVRPGALRITGALTEPMVARALRRHRPDLRRCTGEAMMLGVPALGELELALDVGGDGAITEVHLRSPWVQTLSDCVIAAAKRWAMPRPSDGEPATIVLSVKLEQR